MFSKLFSSNESLARVVAVVVGALLILALLFGGADGKEPTPRQYKAGDAVIVPYICSKPEFIDLLLAGKSVKEFEYTLDKLNDGDTCIALPASIEFEVHSIVKRVRVPYLAPNVVIVIAALQLPGEKDIVGYAFAAEVYRSA